MYKFRKPFGNINYRQRQKRINNIVKELLVSYVDCKQLQHQGLEHTEGNIPLAKQVLVVFDMVHYSFSKILHIDDITKLDNTECYMNDDNHDNHDSDDDNDDLGETNSIKYTN